MASTYSGRLRLELITSGEQNGTWGVTTNTNLGTLIDEAIAGVSAVNFGTDANVTLTANNGATDEARRAVLECTSSGSLTATRDVIVPAATKLWLVYNSTSGGQSIRVKTASGTGVTIANGKKRYVYCDGTNVVDAITDLPSGATIAGGAVYAAGGTDVAMADGGTGSSLTDPGADRGLFWDDSESAVGWFSLGTGLSFSGTALTLDADLQTWAGVTPSANGQSLVAAADYAAMRALLDLEPGTDFYSKSAADAAFQPLDTQLSNFAANTGVSGTVTVSTSTPSGGADGDIWLERAS